MGSVVMYIWKLTNVEVGHVYVIIKLLLINFNDEAMKTTHTNYFSNHYYTGSVNLQNFLLLISFYFHKEDKMVDTQL